MQAIAYRRLHEALNHPETARQQHRERDEAEEERVCTESRCHLEAPTGFFCIFLDPIDPAPQKPNSNATTNATFFIPYPGHEERILRLQKLRTPGKSPPKRGQIESDTPLPHHDLVEA